MRITQCLDIGLAFINAVLSTIDLVQESINVLHNYIGTLKLCGLLMTLHVTLN